MFSITNRQGVFKADGKALLKTFTVGIEINKAINNTTIKTYYYYTEITNEYGEVVEYDKSTVLTMLPYLLKLDYNNICTQIK